MDAVAHGPASIAALRDAVQKGREPPPAEIVARLPSYWLFVIGTVCIGAFMGQVDASMTQILLPRLEHDFAAPIVSVSLGLPAIFLFGGIKRGDKPKRFRLEHGDIAVWGGPARLSFHGVAPLADGEHALLGRQRINLTFRKAR